MASNGCVARLEKCPRRRTHSPRAVPWEFALPWNVTILHQSAVPVRDDRRHECACARVAAASISHAVGTSVTAKSLNVFGRSAAGRRHSGRCDGDSTTLSEPSTPRHNVRAGNVPEFRRKPHRGRQLRRRVVTQQKFFVQPLCARPGCYEPARKLGRSQARYCGPACRQAVRRVLDRERKWIERALLQRRCCAEHDQAARARPPTQPSASARLTPPPAPPPEADLSE